MTSIYTHAYVAFDAFDKFIKIKYILNLMPLWFASAASDVIEKLLVGLKLAVLLTQPDKY